MPERYGALVVLFNGVSFFHNELSLGLKTENETAERFSLYTTTHQATVTSRASVCVEVSRPLPRYARRFLSSFVLTSLIIRLTFFKSKFFYILIAVTKFDVLNLESGLPYYPHYSLCYTDCAALLPFCCCPSFFTTQLDKSAFFQ